MFNKNQVIIGTLGLALFFFAACGGASKEVAETSKEEKTTAKTETTTTKAPEAAPAKPVADKDGLVQLNIGDAAPMTDYKMKDISGKELSMADVKKDNGLLVMFSCNTCPYVIAWEDRYPKVADYCEKNNIGLLVVNSNEARRDGDDSMDEMKKHAEEAKYNFPYVIDVNHQLADAIGAKKTPDLFLFDKEMKLAYKGAIDDSQDASGVENFFVKTAMENMATGKPIDPNTTKAVGCTIKRIKKL